MKAIRIHERGEPEVLIYENAPRPRLMPGDALVRVCASAITKDELTWDPTYRTANGEPRTPSIPGHEFSGVVEELAPDTEIAKVGEEATALLRFTVVVALRNSLPSMRTISRPSRKRSITSMRRPYRLRRLRPGRRFSATRCSLAGSAC